MKRIFWIGPILIAFLVAGASPAQELRGPKIDVPEMRYDFGKVLQGTQLSHVFQVRNAGNGPLVIDRVVAS